MEKYEHTRMLPHDKLYLKILKKVIKTISPAPLRRPLRLVFV